MRNERPRVANAEHSAAPSPTAASSRDGSTARPGAGPTGRDGRAGSPLDAQILQMLRTRLRTTGSLESVAGEVRRLGTLAAAAHRGGTAGLPAGIRLAFETLIAADGRGEDRSEDAA